MNTRYFVLGSLFALMFLPDTSQAEDSPFSVRVSLGHSATYGEGPKSISQDAGSLFNGQSDRTNVEDGTLAGITFGYSFKERLELALAYQHLGSEMSWFTRYPGCCYSDFEADLSVDTFVLSAQYRFRPSAKLSPYVRAGLGRSRIRLSDIREYWGPMGLGATIATGHESDMNLQLGAGLRYTLSPQWYLEAELFHMRSGEIHSGSSRTFPDGLREPVGAYRFDNLRMTSFEFVLGHRF